MRVFVAGGTGALGRRLVPHLVARGHQVTATTLARPLAGDVAVVIMTEGRGFCNAKAKAELGWRLRHPSWRQGFAEELA